MDLHRGRILLAAVAAQAILFAGLPSAEAQGAPSPEVPAAATPDQPVPTPSVAPLVPVTPVTPAPDRITFELKVPQERGGGSISGSAAELESYGESQVTASGAVEIHFRDVIVRAERLSLDRDTMTVQAEGDVVFDQGPQRISGQRLDFDLEQRTGTFWQATAFVHPDYYFSGDIIAKTGPNDFAVDNGVFTSCTGDRTPDWSFAMSSAEVEVEGYARVKNARLRVKKLPVFYWPYMIWPAKTERTSGLLVPNVGYSQRRGEYLGMAWYQVLGPSYDNTLYLDAYSEGFYGVGDEFRYRPSDATRGQARVYYFHNEELADDALRFDWSHVDDALPFGMRGVVDIEHYTDFEVFRDFERSESQNTRRFVYSNAFASGNWGAHSLNILADRRETFLGDNRESVTQSQLPEIAYNLRDRKLGGSPFYLSLGATANYLQAEREDDYAVGYGRFDLQPEVKLPLRPAPWLSVAVTAGGRATWWGDSYSTREVDPKTGRVEQRCGDSTVPLDQEYCGETLTRVYPTANVEMVGPSFSRIFETGGKSFSKFKHIIEPRWSYGFLGEFTEQDQVAQFDEIDLLIPSNFVEVALVNRLLARPADELLGGSFEILSFELSQAYSLDDEQPLQKSRSGLVTDQSSALFAKLRFNPSRAFSLQARAVYSTLFKGLESTSLTGGAKLSRGRVDLTWFTRFEPESFDVPALSGTLSDQVRFGFGVDLLPKRLRLDGQINYDIENGEIQQQRYFLNYVSQCWSVQVEGREYTRGLLVDRDYRLSLTLKNVGSFLDISGGTSDDGF